MCPEYERVERIVQKMVDRSEKVRIRLCTRPRQSLLIDSPVFASGQQHAPDRGVEDAEAFQTVCCWVR